MQVTDMQEELREEGNIFETPTFFLGSYKQPRIYSHGVYIRGSKKLQDLNVSVLQFNTNRERDSYLNKVIKLCDDYNDSEVYINTIPFSIENNIIQFGLKTDSFKIDLFKKEKCICMQVLDQPEEIRGRGRLFCISAYNINSWSQVELGSKNEIRLRGSNTKKDLDIVCAIFSCNEERDMHYDDIVNTFREYSKTFHSPSSVKKIELSIS